jgi:hypothetical protein
MFTQRSCWGSRSFGMWQCANGWVVPNIPDEHCAFIFNGHRVIFVSKKRPGHLADHSSLCNWESKRTRATGHYRQFTTDRSLPTGHYRKVNTDRSLPTCHYRQVTTDRSLPTGHYRQVTTDRSLPTGHYRYSFTGFHRDSFTFTKKSFFQQLK